MTDDAELRLDNPILVQWEFASEERLDKRNSIYRKLVEGDNAEDVLFTAVAEVAPQRVLDVGCGTGEMAERIARELGAHVTALDSSPRMVRLTRERGIDAQVGDIQSLDFGDDSFDCVVAGWVLYHVPDRPRAIAECARVLRPGGRLAAATLASNNLAELWELLGADLERDISFAAENGQEQLEPYFARVERRDAHGVVVFPTPDAMRSYVAANITRAHLAANVPDFTEPVRARTYHTIFVGEKAG
ncbi:MAG TPA: methyltransferase domain-containing protein [Gaiellaceae bacterium]|jgi:ubiquinone/menaquinone biosynthesis C-methylase UbiE